ncbi:MAG: hypothetical protein ABIA63_01225, partial [bacterium]
MSGFAVGIFLRSRYLKLPLDWDHGILLYQSYWYYKIKKFVVGWYEIEPTDPLSGLDRGIGEEYMIRSQSLSHSFIYLIMYRICRDRVWAYRLFDTFYFLVTALVLFVWGMILFDPVSAAMACALFYIFSAMPFFWVADDNPEKFQLVFTITGLLAVSLFLKTGDPLLMLTAG